MAATIRFRLGASFLLFAILLTGCNLPLQPTVAVQPTDTASPAPNAAAPTTPAPTAAAATATPVPTVPAATATPAPTLAQTIQATLAATATPTTASGPSAVNPQCKVLKDLSLYAGPGTAYLLQLAVIRAGTVVVPTGYNPVGNPSASWALVTDPVSQKQGWIIATADYINCNLDLTTLAAVSVTPPAPGCRTLQNINLYPGPGSAYWTDLLPVPANTILAPSNYYPTGVPGGTWVYVNEPISQKKGWVSASTRNIECNLDITALPSMTVSTPPTPPPPHADMTSSTGSVCQDGKNGKTYDCSVVVSDNSFLQVKVLKNGKGIGKSQGMDYINFEVVDQTDNSNYSYSRDDAPYCIFGGSGGCNSWQYTGGMFTWPQYTNPLNTDHTYKVDIVIYSSSLSINLTWEGNFKFSVLNFPMQP